MGGLAQNHSMMARLGRMVLERGADRYIEKGSPVQEIVRTARQAVAERRAGSDQ